ncbi:hypothetical protein P1X15_06175 [Runella sp. MFBS21]|uniref:hypothetical protein n=1 Tax=Runella sp. MFBS21 TaxID=3034018 RepID=UPI0023F8B3EE|nr:hypothetical protein [Runella sp. MFBS21]MDF7817173.1 hypothetical protein [Runella sp. MFBS21]
MYPSSRLKKLLCLDASAASMAAIGLFLLKGFLQPYFRLPLELLSAMGFIALSFAAYGFYLVLRKS